VTSIRPLQKCSFVAQSVRAAPLKGGKYVYFNKQPRLAASNFSVNRFLTMKQASFGGGKLSRDAG
jgi:hypothetical protein